MNHTMGPDYTISGGMDHSGMDHSGMNHSGMDHSGHTTMMPGHGGHMPGMDMMKMYFHADVEAVILFSGWHVSTVGGMVGSCFAVFVMAALYEGLKVLREYLLRKFNVHIRQGTRSYNSAYSTDTMITETFNTVSPRLCSASHYLQTFLHIVQVIISYFLMLIFMTYNIWLCMAVALGAGTGYFIFGWKKAVVIDINEHCH